MNQTLLQALMGTVLVLIAPFGWTENPKPCVNSGPPSIWIAKSPYPFQAGSERTYDELYHGPWRTQVDIVLYARPRSRHVTGEIKAGAAVQAVLGESIVVHPLRFTAAKDTQVSTGSAGGKLQVAVMHKGDVFWVLNLQSEGSFAIWWRCSVVGWDSTEPPYADEGRLKLLGTNEQRWVEIRDMKTGLSGWFKDVPTQNGPKLRPAQATRKSTG